MDNEQKINLDEPIPKPDYDTRWKEIIEQFAPHFVQFNYPRSLWRQIDHKRGIKPMNDELHKIFPDFDKKGHLYPDKLLKMYLKTGQEHLVIVHTEVERNPKKNVGKRVYNYFVRLQDRNPNAIITSLVVFIGNYIPENCHVYTYGQFGTKLTFRYKVCKVKALNEAKLLKSKNPIALVMLAALYNIRTEGKENINERLRFKLKLAKLCFAKGYDKEFIKNLLLFVNFTIALPQSRESVYQEVVHSLLKKEKMPLIDEWPLATIQVQELVLYGETLEEKFARRDAEQATRRAVEQEAERKKAIKNLLREGVEPVIIAKALNIELKEVLALQNKEEEK